MLKIKLARFGKTHQPHYRFVVTEARDKRDGKYVANLGHYAPTQEPKLLDLDIAAYDEWKKKGAQPTDTVDSLAERFRSGKGFDKKKTLSKKAKAKLAQPEEVAAEAPAAAPTTEAPAETVEAAPEAAPTEVAAE